MDQRLVISGIEEIRQRPLPTSSLELKLRKDSGGTSYPGYSDMFDNKLG